MLDMIGAHVFELSTKVVESACPHEALLRLDAAVAALCTQKQYPSTAWRCLAKGHSQGSRESLEIWVLSPVWVLMMRGPAPCFCAMFWKSHEMQGAAPCRPWASRGRGLSSWELLEVASPVNSRMVLTRPCLPCMSGCLCVAWRYSEMVSPL